MVLDAASRAAPGLRDHPQPAENYLQGSFF